MKRAIHWPLWALAAASPVLLSPIGDPDLWWHLSAAKRALIEFPVRADWLSWTMAGAPWVNFEWLSGLVFYLVYKTLGLSGLWALKAVLLGLVVEAARRLARAFGAGEAESAAAAALCALALLPRADIRMDLFSLAGFAWLWVRLKAGTKPASRIKEPAGLFLVFALWANLHAGFAYGLLLLGLYAVEAAVLRSPRRASLFAGLAAAALGTLLNPYGARVYGVLLAHAKDGAALAASIAEWAPLNLARLPHAPTFLLVFIALWGLRAASAQEKNRVLGSPAVWAALLIYGALGLKHARLAAYFAVLLVPFAANAIGRLNLPNAAAGVLAGAFAFGAAAGMEQGLFRAVHHDGYWPARLSKFLKRGGRLAGLDAYHPWGWGGYLGFHASPPVRVFQDGRSLFHGLLAEAAGASASPDTWGSFLESRGVKAAALVLTPARVPALRRYPDGTSREFLRPYYTAFMPKEKWALVYFDEKALFFVRRGALPEDELSRLEYKLLRPGDEAALRDAMARGEIDAAELERERARHASVLRSLDD